MDTFFNTVYYYLRSLYSQELDNYLYSTIPGYLHLGIILFKEWFICHKFTKNSHENLLTFSLKYDTIIKR